MENWLQIQLSNSLILDKKDSKPMQSSDASSFEYLIICWCLNIHIKHPFTSMNEQHLTPSSKSANQQERFTYPRQHVRLVLEIGDNLPARKDT